MTTTNHANDFTVGQLRRAVDKLPGDETGDVLDRLYPRQVKAFADELAKAREEVTSDGRKGGDET